MKWLILLALCACETKQDYEDRKWIIERKKMRRVAICNDFCVEQENRLIQGPEAWTCTCADGSHMAFDDMRVFYEKPTK